jgi:hypothetical protein
MANVREQLIKIATELNKEAARPLTSSEWSGRAAGEHLFNARLWDAERKRAEGAASRLRTQFTGDSPAALYGQGLAKKMDTAASDYAFGAANNLEHAKYMADVGASHKARQIAEAGIPAEQAANNLSKFLAASRAPEKATAAPSLMKRLLAKIAR